MNKPEKRYDCIVLGAGIFGLSAAAFFASRGYRVALIEKEDTVFANASRYNQARVHRGYHYPRSLSTAKAAAEHYERFCTEFRFALTEPFKSIYAVAAHNSKVSAEEYVQFCKEVDIPLTEVDPSTYFAEGTVSAAWEVGEASYNFAAIREYYLKKLKGSRLVDIHNNTQPIAQKKVGDAYQITLSGKSTAIEAPFVVNATYSSVNDANTLFGHPGYDVKYELCELALYDRSSSLAHTGITVVDGPFFSFMPYGDGSVVSLTSVGLTPHHTSTDKPQTNLLDTLRGSAELARAASRRASMEQLAMEYLKPGLSDFSYRDSVFAIKPILKWAEQDDDRPTLIDVHSTQPYFVSVLSGKVSGIYELERVLEGLLDAQSAPHTSRKPKTALV
ncbi:MAG TPA: FAD-dependent oxidoreductase [Patescibacteria group bacterium]|nr:FAD-dependent oxidoreductase [Patescibacteria group bacterium]